MTHANGCFLTRIVLLTTLLVAGASLLSAQTPTIAGCQVLPANDVWNTPVDNLPVAANSDAYVQTLGATDPLHPDYGKTGGYQIALVPGNQAKVNVNFSYDGDPGPYPIPPNPPIEPGNGDRHLFLLDTTNCIDYELFNLQLQPDGSWQAGSGAIYPLNSHLLRAKGRTSADAAGLPMVPGMIRYDEANSGVINHAIRFTGMGTANYSIWPARHAASSLSGLGYPPMGQRFRLKASYDISKFPPRVQAILTALKKYGMILADNGTPWHVQGVEDSRWNDDEQHMLTQLIGADFEAVDESSLMREPNSGQAMGSVIPTSIVPTGWTSLLSKNSGQCLHVVNNASTNWGKEAGAPLDQYPCTAGLNQQFQFTAVPGGYTITSRNSGLVLQVAGGSTSNGAAIVQAAYTGAKNQIWTVSAPGGMGYSTLTPLNSGKCLDVISTAATAQGMNWGTHVQQYTCSGGAMQSWKAVPPQQ